MGVLRSPSLISAASLLLLALTACLGSVEAGIPQQEQPADAYYRWPDYWDDNFNYPPEEKYSELKSPKYIADLKHGNKTHSENQANMTVGVWNKRKGHVVRDISKSIYAESFFYELHLTCTIRDLDITDWAAGEEQPIICNIGLHNSRNSRDWLQLKMMFDPARTEEENLKTIKCIDQFQERTENGDFHEAEKVVDDHQNCYVYFVNATATITEEEAAQSSRRILQDDSATDGSTSGDDGSSSSTSTSGDSSSTAGGDSSSTDTSGSSSASTDTTSTDTDSGSGDASSGDSSTTSTDDSSSSSTDPATNTDDSSGDSGTNGSDSSTNGSGTSGDGSSSSTPDDGSSSTGDSGDSGSSGDTSGADGTGTGSNTGDDAGNDPTSSDSTSGSDPDSGSDGTEQQTSRKLATFNMHVMRPLNPIDASGQDIAISLGTNVGLAIQLVVPGEERTTGTTIHIPDTWPSSKSFTKGDLTQ